MSAPRIGERVVVTAVEYPFGGHAGTVRKVGDDHRWPVGVELDERPDDIFWFGPTDLTPRADGEPADDSMPDGVHRVAG